MKKILTLFLMFCVVFSALLPVTAETAENEMAQTKVILSEDFESEVLADSIYGESGELNSNNDIGGVGFNGWEDAGAAYKNPIKPYEGNRTVIIAKRYEEEGNKIGKFTYTVPGSESSNSFYAYEVHKATTEQVNTGLVIFKLKAMPTADAGLLLFNLKSGAATAAPYLIFDGKNKRINSSPGVVDTGSGRPITAMQTDTWGEYEIWFNYREKKARIFINGVEMENTRPSMDTSSNGLAFIGQLSMGLHRYQGAWAANAGWSVDDIKIIAVADLDARMIPTDDGDLTKAKLTFNNTPVGGISASNITIDVDGTDYTASAIEPVLDDDKSFIVTFPVELAPGKVEYTVTLNGFYDEYDYKFENKEIPYKTREKRYEISDAVFYTGYGTEEELDVLSFGENGTYTAEFKIKNELPVEFVGDVVLVHKRGEEIVKAVAVDANVPAETNNATITASMTISDYQASDKLEAYIWDSVQSMNAYKPVSTINASGIEVESAFVSQSAASDISMNAAVDFENESMILSGKATEAAEVCALVFDPGYDLSNLTVDNFDAAVSNVAQKATDNDGNYLFNCKISAPQDHSEYYAAVGANSITKTDNALFFVMSTVNNTVATIKDATAEELADLLSGKIQLAGNIPLNDVLQMDMSVYNSLKHKNEVCEALAKAEVTDVASIRTAFADIVAVQEDKEEYIAERLNEINNAIWSEIEAELKKDLDDKNYLDLPWDGSFDEIKDEEDLLEDFYKSLKKYTFTDYLQLKEAFENEAKAVLDAEDKKGSSSGGGGGGSSNKLGYSAGMTGVNKLEPLPTVTEEEVKTTNFTDIAHVLWANEAIISLAKDGIISGVGDGKFAPDLKVTREQFVKMIVLAFDLYNKDAKTDKFIDIPEGEWYSAYIASALDKGIVYGVDDEHFGVGKEITRAEMAVILVRAYEATGEVLADGDALTYSDNEQIPAYACDSIAKLTKAGIMSGVGDNMFAPHDKATRAMAAKVIYMLRGLVK